MIPEKVPFTLPPEVKPATPSSKNNILYLVLAVILVSTLIIMYYLLPRKHSIPSETTKSASEEPANAVFNLTGYDFAQFQETKSTVVPSLKPYTLISTELANLAAIRTAAGIQFSSGQINSLDKQGFFVQPSKPMVSNPNTTLSRGGSRSDDMVDLYRDIGGSFDETERRPENAVFVTTDFLLHVYHVLVDRTFQNIEEFKFFPVLKQLTDSLYTDALGHYQTESEPAFKESWKRLAVFYLVPKTIMGSAQVADKQYFATPDDEQKSLDSDQTVDTPGAVSKLLQQSKAAVPAEIYDLTQQELDLVMAGKTMAVSPLFGSLNSNLREDYTQYTPRSHYTKDSVLRSYFRAMMWYGRHGFDVKSQNLTRDALLMTWQLNSVRVANQSARKVWEQIYLPTVFFVGRSDDLTVYEYTDLTAKIFGSNVAYAALKDTTKLSQFIAEAEKLPGPKILSSALIYSAGNVPEKDELLKSTQGFRFMGQRFIPDSYMFSSLTQGDEPPDPETGQKLPSTPTALMIMSILGSKTADSLLDDWIETNAPQSNKVIAKYKNLLIAEFAKYDEKTWTQNIYWSWLYTLKPLFADHSGGYPMFMQGAPWSKKSLISALGSWTELRHDTLLYAKQSYAELGGGPDEQPTPPPVPKGYVEPNLDLITRLIALAKMTSTGLESRGLMPDDQKDKFNMYIEDLQFFKTIAERELSDQVITDADYENLRTVIGQRFPRIVWVPNGGEMTEKDARIGIIADVHTNVPEGRILYEATGVPSVIYVAVKDKGGARLTRGVVYSYYEFTRPIAARMTDEEWQGMLYDGKNPGNLPAVPAWTAND